MEQKGAGTRLGHARGREHAVQRPLVPAQWTEAFQALLHPRGIAVVGASTDTEKFAGRIVPSLLACGYTGSLYPVNPRYQAIDGLPCYPSVRQVPMPCDLVIVAVPAQHVVGVVKEAAAHNVGAAIILSAGFDEVGGEGDLRAAELRRLVAETGIRIYGPNCPGLWQIRDRLVVTFSAQFDPSDLRSGPVGLVSQGGALGRAVLDAMETGLGFSYWFSTGNEVDLEASDFIDFLAEDSETTVIAAILEGWRDEGRLRQALEHCRRVSKPVVLLKIGATPAGAMAARNHTAAKGGAVSGASMRSWGCIPVEDLDELTDVARLFARYPEPHPGGIGVCTFSGGAGGLLADQAALAGASLPPLAATTAASLRSLLPEIAAVANPTDLTTAVFQDPDLVVRSLERMADDPNFGILLFPLPHRHDHFDPIVARALVDLVPRLAKPLVVVALSPTFSSEEADAILRAGAVPVISSARRAAHAAAAWLAYGNSRLHR